MRRLFNYVLPVVYMYQYRLLNVTDNVTVDSSFQLIRSETNLCSFLRLYVIQCVSDRLQFAGTLKKLLKVPFIYRKRSNGALKND